MALLASRRSSLRAQCWAGALLLAGLTAGACAENHAVEAILPADSPGPSMVLPYLRAYLAERGAAPKASSGLQLQDLVVASPPPSQAALQVTRWRWDALRQEIQFYLRCSTPQICRPFLATARPRDDEVLAALRAVAPGGAPAAPSPFANAGIKTSLPHEARLIRTGEHVRLLLAGPNIRIQLAAICLEPGGLGQRVRVRGIGDTKVFLARVMGPGWLAAEFP